MASPSPESPPLWPREPYRLLFPLGVLLAQVGVLHWLLYAVGALVLLARVSRVLMAYAPMHLRLWLGGAAAAFLVATLLWELFLVPLTRGDPAPHA